MPAGDSALLVETGDAAGSVDIPALARAARDALSAIGRIDVIAAHDSLLIRYDPMTASPDDVSSALRSVRIPGDRSPGGYFSIPVLYGGDAGPDLVDVASLHGMEPGDVVRRHTAVDYRVRFIGFSPGFPYLDGLDPALHTGRLPSPRVHVLAGSVAIGGSQAGVYPVASPGGWRIIGRTPAVLFDPRRDPPVVYDAGDVFRFTRIDADEFERRQRDRQPPERIA